MSQHKNGKLPPAAAPGAAAPQPSISAQLLQRYAQTQLDLEMTLLQAEARIQDLEAQLRARGEKRDTPSVEAPPVPR